MSQDDRATKSTSQADGTEQVVMAFLTRTGEGDAAAIGELFADEIDWYVGGNPAVPWTGHRSRRSEVVDDFQSMWSQLEPGAGATVLDSVLISGDDAVVFAHFTNTVAMTGREFRTPVAMRLAVKGGVIVTMHLHEDTWAVSNAFIA